MPKYRVSRHSVTQPLDKPYRLIPLTQGQNAIVDADDFEWLSQWNWSAEWKDSTKSFYAKRNGGGGHWIKMHRLILKCNSRSQEVDHINRNSLDNRRTNLRKCTHAQNNQNKGQPRRNTSGFKGVYYWHERKKWQAYITVNYIRKSLGYFLVREDAARAYDKAAIKYFGKFAVLNLPSDYSLV